MRLTVENCSQVRINDLQKRVRKIIEKDWPDASIEESYDHTMEELKGFSVNGQTFEYESMRNHLGGHRWFFLCPKCNQRVNKLILPPEGIGGREKKYLCKTCHRIRNQSAVLGQNSMYQKVTRPLKRMKEIEDKIAVGHLTTDKVKELLDEYDALESQVKSEPDYRLYMFKKKHGLMSQ